MQKRLALAAAVTAALLAVSGCTLGQRSNTGQQGRVGAPADLSAANSPLGEIVVDADGMTVYVFDKDTAGTDSSACTDDCAKLWPPVTTTAEPIQIVDVPGTVGTITSAKGDTQLTLNGLPLYTYRPDARQGDMTGQGVDHEWWAVRPSGEKITAPAPTPSPRGY